MCRIRTSVGIYLLGCLLGLTATVRGQVEASGNADPSAAPAGSAATEPAEAPSPTPVDAVSAPDTQIETTGEAVVRVEPDAGEAGHAKDDHATSAAHTSGTSETHGDASHAADGHAAHGGGHDHHDPFDLSHQNATKAISQVDELKADLALWSFVVFLLLLAVLSKFAWGPIMQGLHAREESIAAMIDDAKASSEKAAEMLRQYEAKLAAASDEINELRVQARKDAEATKDRVLAEARDAAQRERERAVADIGLAKTAALQEITSKSVDLAVILASRLIQRQLTADDRVGLVREALDQMPSRN
jgi:F-type H+-transporting ATPase subunit b